MLEESPVEAVRFQSSCAIDMSPANKCALGRLQGKLAAQIQGIVFPARAGLKPGTRYQAPVRKYY